jgi:hypothetical protein
VLEDFDKIFNDNDEKKLLELDRLSRKMGPGGVLPQVRPHFFSCHFFFLSAVLQNGAGRSPYATVPQVRPLFFFLSACHFFLLERLSRKMGPGGLVVPQAKPLFFFYTSSVWPHALEGEGRIH